MFTMQFETRQIGKLQTLLWLRLRQTSVLGEGLGETLGAHRETAQGPFSRVGTRADFRCILTEVRWHESC